jgi:hypothetical protein
MNLKKLRQEFIEHLKNVDIDEFLEFWDNEEKMFNEEKMEQMSSDLEGLSNTIGIGFYSLGEHYASDFPVNLLVEKGGVSYTYEVLEFILDNHNHIPMENRFATFCRFCGEFSNSLYQLDLVNRCFDTVEKHFQKTYCHEYMMSMLYDFLNQDAIDFITRLSEKYDLSFDKDSIDGLITVIGDKK